MASIRAHGELAATKHDELRRVRTVPKRQPVYVASRRVQTSAGRVCVRGLDCCTASIRARGKLAGSRCDELAPRCSESGWRQTAARVRGELVATALCEHVLTRAGGVRPEGEHPYGQRAGGDRFRCVCTRVRRVRTITNQ